MVIAGDVAVDGAIITGGAVVADTTMVGAIIAIGGDRLLITYQEAASVWLGPLSS